MAGRTFKVILIKPSHYDADGYVIQWWRSLVPSNSLASMYGLMAECAASKSLGDDVDIDIEAYDECNTVIDVKGAIGKMQRQIRLRRSRRRAVQSISPHARYRP